MARRSNPVRAGLLATLASASSMLALALLLPCGCRAEPVPDEGGTIAIAAPTRALARAPVAARSATVLLSVRGSDGETLRQATARVARTLATPEDVWRTPAVLEGDPTLFADGQGRFAASITWPERGSLALELRAPDRVARWIWLTAPAGDVLDLGAIVLERAGTVEGVVLDDGGEPVHSEPVVGTVGDFLQGPDGTWVFARAAFTRAYEGRFVLRGVPPGVIEIEARPGRASQLAWTQVLVRAGRVAHATLDAPPRVPRHDVVVEIVLPGPDSALAPVQRVVLVDPDGAELRGRRVDPSKDEQRRARHVFDAVAPGTYRLVIEDPRFQTWIRENVQPGDRLRAELAGSCALRVHLSERDGSSVDFREPLYLSLATTWRAFSIVDRTVTLTRDRLQLEDVVPGDWWIAVRSLNYREVRLKLDRLAHGETRDVEIVLDRAQRGR